MKLSVSSETNLKKTKKTSTEKNKFLSIEKFTYRIAIFFGSRINLLGVP